MERSDHPFTQPFCPKSVNYVSGTFRKDVFGLYTFEMAEEEGFEPPRPFRA